MLLEDAPRHRQDEPRQGARGDRAGHQRAHPVHARPAAVRRHGCDDLRPAVAPVEFHKGPIFASIVLADEINAPRRRRSRRCSRSWRSRGSRSTASRTRPVARSSSIATQNPIEQAGTYKLPEAQLDRFLIKTSIGYPDLAVTESILAGASDRNPSAGLSAIITTSAVADMADLAATVHVEPAVLRYVAELAEATREDGANRLGVSVRGAIAMIRIAKCGPLRRAATSCCPTTSRPSRGPCGSTVLLLDAEAEFAGTSSDTVIARVLDGVAALRPEQRPDDREALQSAPPQTERDAGWRDIAGRHRRACADAPPEDHRGDPPAGLGADGHRRRLLG